jgi:hypothetical protein
MFEPHADPSETLPAEAHTGCPVVQSIVFFWQVPATEQSLPASQREQAPPEQNAVAVGSPEAHGVPSARVTVSWQTGPASPHVYSPTWQTLTLHVAPGVQLTPASGEGAAPVSAESPAPSVDAVASRSPVPGPASGPGGNWPTMSPDSSSSDGLAQ